MLTSTGQVIANSKALDYLPEWTVVIDAHGDPWQKYRGKWRTTGQSAQYESVSLMTVLPLTVVWQPE